MNVPSSLSETDLDSVYTTLAETLGRVDVEKTALFLSTLCLSLLAKQGNAQTAMSVIAQAEKLIRD